jgi:hypothetical protein
MGVKDLISSAFSDPLSITISSLSAVGALASAADDIAGGGLNALAEDLAQMAMRPLVGLIPIYAEQYKVTRQVETPETLVISSESKRFITDNAAPRPRVWKMRGYISSLIPAFENGVIIKPTILLQKTYLDNAAMSRSPIQFKTAEGEFVDILIQNLEFTEDPKIQNKAVIDITLKEFVYLTAEIAVSATNLKGADKAAAKSVPSFMSSVNSQFVTALALGAVFQGGNALSDIAHNGLNIAGVLSGLGGMIFPLPIAARLGAGEKSGGFGSKQPSTPGKTNDHLSVLPLDPITAIPQTTDGSTAYLIPLPDPGGAFRMILDAKCGNYSFRFDFRWDYASQRKFDNLTDMVEKTRKQTNVFALSSYVENDEYVIVTSTVTQPDNLRAFLENHLASYDKLRDFDTSTLNAIKYAMSVQPFIEPSPAVISSWLAKAESIIDAFHNDLWAQNALTEVKKVYGQILALRDLFTSPPAEGLINYLYAHFDDIPDLSNIFVYIQRTYLPVKNLFAELDLAFNRLCWRCIASAPDLGASRTFTVTPNVRLFESDTAYNLTITGAASTGNGNVGFDQLSQTAFVVEIL